MSKEKTKEWDCIYVASYMIVTFLGTVSLQQISQEMLYKMSLNCLVLLVKSNWKKPLLSGF